MIFINPQARRLGVFARYVPIGIPQGIAFLAAYLLANGESVAIHDEEVDGDLTVSHLEALVSNEEKPYIFGFSCVTSGIARAMSLAHLIKDKYPDSRIVMGGVHPTVMPEEPLKHSPTDVVVVGQGELALLALVRLFKGGRGDIEQINNVAFLRGGDIIKTPQSPLISLSELPDIPYHLFEKKLGRYDFGWLTTSLGCPFKCIFCSQRAITGLEVSFNDNEKTIRHLQVLADRYKVKAMIFGDDNFIVKKSRVLSLCDDIVRAGLHEKMSFDCQARGDAIRPDILGALKRANFRVVHVGIEAASERLLKVIKKGETLAQMTAGIRMVKAAGIRTSGTFIFGFPTETKEERQAAYDLAIELGLDYARFNNAVPYPGTEFYNMAKDEGRFNGGKHWERINAALSLTDHPFRPSPMAYVPATATEKELRKAILRANLFFSLRPSRVLRILREGSARPAEFSLPRGWYLRPKELWIFTQFAFRIMGNLVRALV